MICLVVNMRVAVESVDRFVQATLRNVVESRKEPGIAGFDLHRDRDDPSRFILVELYRDADAMVRHKETAHYLVWKDEAEPLLAETRTRRVYDSVEP